MSTNVWSVILSISIFFFSTVFENATQFSKSPKYLLMAFDISCILVLLKPRLVNSIILSFSLVFRLFIKIVVHLSLHFLGSG